MSNERDDARAGAERPGVERPGEGGASADEPGAAHPQQPDALDHDSHGLDVARAVAAGARAKPRPRAASGRRTGGTPAELSGAHPDARDPAPIGKVVDRLVQDSGWTTDVAVHGVFARWPDIVGAEVAAHCTPVHFGDGRLEVQTDSTAWATQLRLLAPTVVRRLNEELGHDTVLRIEVTGPSGPSWRRGPRSVRGARGPRDTYG